MKKYDIRETGKGTIKAIKRGWSWTRFLIAIFILEFCFGMIRGAVHSANADLNQNFEKNISVFLLLLALIYGFWGARMSRGRLLQQAILAKNPTEAISKYNQGEDTVPSSEVSPNSKANQEHPDQFSPVSAQRSLAVPTPKPTSQPTQVTQMPQAVVTPPPLPVPPPLPAIQSPSPVRVATPSDPQRFEQLEKLGVLRERGILTEEEFVVEKQKLLQG